MPRRARLAAVLVVLAASLVAGCTSSIPSLAATIHLDNLTDTPVGVYVNGGWAGTYAAGASGTSSVGGHGAAPYTIEIRSPSNAVLMTMTVTAEQGAQLGTAGKGVGQEVAVPCGALRVIVGTLPEGAAPAPAASVTPGVCP